MIRNWVSIAALAALAAAANALADGAPVPPAQGWSGKGELGYVMARGNTDTDSANAKLDLADVVEKWKYSLHLEGLYGRSSQITSAERWAALIQSDYQFTARAFTFGALHFLQDEFSGFQYQASVTTGVGYRFVATDSNKLTAQVGLGYRRLRPEVLILNANGAVVERIAGDSSGNAIATAGFDYAHIFNASTKIIDKFLAESGAGNTSLENDLALVVNMSKKLALSAGFTFQDNTEPPAGLKKINTLTTLNLVYAFNQ